MKFRMTLLFLVALPFSASSQTACPVGVAAGSPQCGPSPADHLPSTSRPEAAPPVNVLTPTGEWKKTWGAVAADFQVGDIGTVVGKRSKEEAEREAMSRCATHGADGCKIQIAYLNQCVALFFPGVVGGKAFAATGATEMSASDIGREKCSVLNGSACNFAYSECTKPIYDHF